MDLFKIIVSSLLISIGTMGISQQEMALIDSLQRELTHAQTPEEKGIVCVALAKSYQTVDLTKSRDYGLLAIANLGPESELLPEAFDQLGRYYFYRSQWDSASYYFQQTKELLIQAQDTQRVSALNISIGSVYLQQARYTDAISVFIESLQYFEPRGDEVNAAKCYSNLASAFAQMDNYPEAIRYSQEALAIFKAQGMDQYTMITLPNLATQYMQNGQMELANTYFIEAEDLALKYQNKRSLALIYTSLGDLHLEAGRLELAKAYTLKSIQLKEELNQTKGVGQAYHNLGLIAFKQHRYQEAKENYTRAMQDADSESQVELMKRMKEVLSAEDNWKEALYYAEAAQRLNDSLLADKNMKDIATVVNQFESAKKENEILQLKANNQELAIRHNRNRILLWSFIGLCGILLWVVYLTYQNIQRKRLIDKQNFKINQQAMIEQLRRHESQTLDNIIQIQESERSQIAADLHDSLGSKLATLSLYVEKLQEDIPQEKHLQLGLEQLKKLTGDTYREVRQLSHSINAGAQLQKGLLVALQHMANYISQTNNIKIEVLGIDLDHRIDNALEIQLFRVIQELITNVIKHANATEVTIQLTKHDDVLNIIVEDNGSGFLPGQVAEGMGLKNIENRLTQIGGECSIDSSPGHGTTIIINTPL